jgi:hypothetical protein
VVAPLSALRSGSFAAFECLRPMHSRQRLPEPEPEPTPVEAAVAWAEAEWGAGAVSRSALHADALRFHVLLLALLTLLLPEAASAAVRTAAMAALVPLLLWLWQCTAILRQIAEHIHEPVPADLPRSSGQAATSGGSSREDGHSDSPGRGAQELPGLRQTPGMPPLPFWGEPSATSYRLRSRSYLSSGVKRASAPAIFSLFALDCFQCEDADDRYNLIGRPDHWLNKGKAGKGAAAGAHGGGNGGNGAKGWNGGRGGGGGKNGGGNGLGGGGGVKGNGGKNGASTSDYTFVLNVIIPSVNNLILVAYFRESSPGLLSSGADTAALLPRRTPLTPSCP